MYTQEKATQSFDKTIMGPCRSYIKLVFSLAIRNQVNFSLLNTDKQKVPFKLHCRKPIFKYL